MRRNKPSVFLSLLILMVFLAGLFLLLYPYLWGAVVDHGISLEAKDFLNRGDTASSAGSDAIVTIDNTEPTGLEIKAHPELWADMVRYNETIYTQGQAGLSCAYDYQQPSFRFSDYGLDSEV